MIILDTNVLSALMRKAIEALLWRDWIASWLSPFWITSITLVEAKLRLIYTMPHGLAERSVLSLS